MWTIFQIIRLFLHLLANQQQFIIIYNKMIEKTIKEEEMPYDILKPFGLTREMIEDLPLQILQRISEGYRSPLLPIHITDEQGNLVKSRTRFSLIRGEDGKVDVLFYPQLQQTDLMHFSEEKLVKLLGGKAIIAEMPLGKGQNTMAFHQFDTDTGQVLSVPTPVIGRNLQLLADKLHLGNAELNCLKNGGVLTVSVVGESVEDELLTMGIDLNIPTGIRFSDGDERQWRQQRKPAWSKYNFGCFGCWTMDEEGNLDYVHEDDYTEEMWDELKKKGEKRTGQSHKI